MSIEKDPTVRFSNRVENYIKYRPGYPDSLIGFLGENLGLHAGSVVADVGCGTGILSKLLLEWGAKVYGVEPNSPMRTAAEQLLKGFAEFHSVEGRSEATNLPDQSVDLITAAQAFHWFEPGATKQEFSRILRPQGQVALIWNSRDEPRSPVAWAYQNLIDEFAIDYEEMHHKRLQRADFENFFAPGTLQTAHFDYGQELDLDGLKGRLLSCSYMPGEDHPSYYSLLKAIEAAFEQVQTDGKVVLPYITELYYGQMG
ncbi:MAG: class I SAM-dependent methyltransferase [Bacteroidia bacterium]|nr:class I SAM-dependent methyltransferase [Bacteroidia bacterium]